MYFATTDALADWLVQVLSEETDLNPQDINPRASFAALGIDSVESVSLACRLDEVFEGFTVKPDLFWEVDCIDELAKELFDRNEAVKPDDVSASRDNADNEARDNLAIGNGVANAKEYL